jgi:hypothetical protein
MARAMQLSEKEEVGDSQNLGEVYDSFKETNALPEIGDMQTISLDTEAAANEEAKELVGDGLNV